ncbi:hypothetical protein GGE07_005096 [Sinorhizobium terangae]|uniref:hypothetical protein n=1 Tax=Sinorhizobium terangae TaxID=110322 RepID=UPI001837B863|nr:hypothetical protein [Sinorhizobium terangae]MBB4188417.1 hypothetical protein [Sinorhizobium terangae]
MMRFAPLTRDFYIPKGFVKVTDKASDAIVCVCTSAKDRPAAMAFHGKAQKPDWHHTFAGEAARDLKIHEHFEGRRRWAEWKAGTPRRAQETPRFRSRAYSLCLMGLRADQYRLLSGDESHRPPHGRGPRGQPDCRRYQQ